MNNTVPTKQVTSLRVHTVKSTVVPHLSSDAPPSLLTANGQMFNNSILQPLQWKPGDEEESLVHRIVTELFYLALRMYCRVSG